MRVWRIAVRVILSMMNFNSHTREGVTSLFSCLCLGVRISTHTPVRVWPMELPWIFQQERFQLTHPWGCDFVNTIYTITVHLFQLTHPWGCDYYSHLRGFLHWYFNSHTREGVTGQVILLSGKRGDFNSHTREGVTATTGICALSRTFQLTHPWGCDARKSQHTHQK